MRLVIVGALLAVLGSWPARADPNRGEITLAGLDWHRGGAHKDWVVADFTVSNGSPFAVRYFMVRCHLSDAAGAVLPPTFASIDEPLAPGQTRQFRGFTLGVEIPAATTSVACDVSFFGR